MVFFLAVAAGLTESAAALARRRFAHLAFCVAAIFLFTEALMVRLFFAAAPGSADAPRIARSSLFSSSICSLIAVARLSWVMVRSNKFMGTFINIQSWWKSSAGQVLLAGNDTYRRHLNLWGSYSPQLAALGILRISGISIPRCLRRGSSLNPLPVIASRPHMIQGASKFQANRSRHWRPLTPGDYKVKD